jgi:hypothetical protein
VITGAAALLTIAAAILAATVVLLRTGSLRQALPVLLDLLTAAGLLRLIATPTWGALAVTAIVIALRRLVTSGIRTASAARRTQQRGGVDAR